MKYSSPTIPLLPLILIILITVHSISSDSDDSTLNLNLGLGSGFIPKTSFSGSDITPQLFSNPNDLFPAAYADFNGDKITDVFIISPNKSSFSIYFGHEEVPVFRPGPPGATCHLLLDWSKDNNQNENHYSGVRITGLVPGDFNGDGLLDVLVSFNELDSNNTQILIFTGNLTSIQCTRKIGRKDRPYLKSEPLVLDLNGDMILDLFAEDENGTKLIYLFKESNQVTIPVPIKFNTIDPHGFEDNRTRNLSSPNVNSYLDTNGDGVPELIILTIGNMTTNTSTQLLTLYQFKVYSVSRDDDNQPKFTLSSIISIDESYETHHIGQSIFMDLNRDGHLVHLVPFCKSVKCQNGEKGIKIIPNGYNGDRPFDLPIEFTDDTGDEWSFWIGDSNEERYGDSIILRVGDYNLDGYPDLIGVLHGKHSGKTGGRAVVFENVPCDIGHGGCARIPRTFKLNFQALEKYSNVTMSSWFDIHEDGLLDIILVHLKDPTATRPDDYKYSIVGIENSPDYDANFIKVMVLSGRDCPNCPNENLIPYGNIISGPLILYNTTTQVGLHQSSVGAQNYRSCHFPLDVPYVILGIGQSPNFIETLEIRYWAKGQEWTQIIPNSQIIVVPGLGDDGSWTAKLFLTPSKAVLHTFGVLVGFCVGILGIVGVLQWREQKADRLERMKAHRFHMM